MYTRCTGFWAKNYVRKPGVEIAQCKHIWKAVSLQAARFREFEPKMWAGAVMAASHLNTEQARKMVPGIGPSILQEAEDHAALLLQGGLVLDTTRYLQQSPPLPHPLVKSLKHCHDSIVKPIFAKQAVALNAYKISRNEEYQSR